MSDDRDLQAENERLKAELAALQKAQAKASEGSAVAQGQDAKAVATGGTLIEGSVYIGKETEDPAEALNIYRRVLVQTTTSLPLRGVDVGASDPTGEQKSIGLANVYVDLDTKTPVETQREASERDQRLGVSGIIAEVKALSILDAAISKRHLVLLGDPGSGKSTFVNFLAHCLAAHALDPEAGWLKNIEHWHPDEAETLPVMVILRDFARSYADKLPAKAEPRHLLDFIQSRLKAQNLAFVLPLLEKALENGQAIVLLDGLDEVPTQDQRVFVRAAVRAFIQRYEKSRFLVTCRVLSYQPPEKDKPDLRLTELPLFEIAPFDEEKIQRFVKAWYAELVRLGTVKGEDQKDLTARLETAVQRPDLRRLASNPLLLTVMALVHTHKGRLPDARALLYEETIDILLWRWEQIKLGGQEDAPRLRQYLLEAGRTDVDLKCVLWRLAYQAHVASKPDDSDDALADISEHHILNALAALKCDEDHPDGDLNWAKHLVDLMKLRAGLLLERQPEMFSFPHRTFQEYLAGAHLAAQLDFSQQVTQLVQKEMSLWREVVLYAVGKLVYVNGDVPKPLALVAELCPADVQDDDTAWQQVWLAGDVLQEIGLKRVQDSAFGRDLLKRTQTCLTALLAGGKLAPQERAAAGNTLAALGDPRFDPDTWYLPTDPMFSFVEIPAGSFVMGSDKNQDQQARDNELPQHELSLPRYWIAKYPVTVAQFRAFVEESVYEFGFWEYNPIANHPMVVVTWHEALKYCEWLTKKLSVASSEWVMKTNLPEATRRYWQGLADGSLRVTLPNEAEWEKTARAADGRVYPWGDEPDPDKANYIDTGIGTTSAVGCFPAGASSYGVLDLSGNVLEWTRSIWDNEKYPYPYKPADGRENLESGSSRVLRGGSFAHNRYDARCAYRFNLDPDYRDHYIGFRVVVSA